MITASCIDNKYVLPIQIQKDGRTRVLKFDTGAVCTVISVDFLLKDLDSQQVEVIKNSLKKYKIREFVLANGNKIQGILCSIKNVIMDTTAIPKFYFYLIINISNLALLGYDFIGGCNFTHIRGGDINITAIDIKHQESIIKQQGLEALELNSLECELQEMES